MGIEDAGGIIGYLDDSDERLLHDTRKYVDTNNHKKSISLPTHNLERILMMVETLRNDSVILEEIVDEMEDSEDKLTKITHKVETIYGQVDRDLRIALRKNKIYRDKIEEVLSGEMVSFDEEDLL